jgi:hypothetical protein
VDKINFVYMANNLPRAQRRFGLNAEGRKEIDLLFFPVQCCLKITVCYSSFVLHEALNKLQELNITTVHVHQHLTDDKLELLLGNN